VSNVAEGFDGETNREFMQFLIVARASSSEVKSQLYVALDRGYLAQDAFKEAYDQAAGVVSLIDGFIRFLRKPRT